MRINWRNFSRCQISEGDLEFPEGNPPGYMPRIITGLIIDGWLCLYDAVLQLSPDRDEALH